MTDIPTNHAQREFVVTRDAAGVPHISAATWHDALYGLGYMHATDRGTQLLFSRTVASGRAAEQIAPKDELIETDRFFRLMGLHLNVQQEAVALDDRTRQQLLVYCAGVNDGLKAKGRTLPMWATGYQPEPWEPAAVILVGRLLSFGGLAVSQLQNERLILELIHAGASDAALAELFAPRLDRLDFDLIRQVHISHQLSDEALEVIVDLPRLAGSNAWAVSPWRSATQHALLASDPHLEVNRLPAIWYEAVLQWEDSYVMGATLPGFPLFSVARTPQLAWGVTYMKGDTIDFFVERVRAGGNSGWQFQREDQWYDFKTRIEDIGLRNESQHQLTVYENDLGTLESEPQQDGNYLSVAWTGRNRLHSTAISTWLDLVFAETVTDGMDIVIDCTMPTLCFVFADRAGHIGLQGCGAIPQRANPYDGLVPLPAWDPANHWQGWLPNEVLPSVYDPPEGFVATANEEHRSPDGPMIVTQPVHDYRLRRIRERLQELPSATVGDMQRLQYDVISVQARDFLEVVLPHLPDGKVKNRLAAWDHSYHPNSVEAPLFLSLYRNVMMEVFGHERGVGWRRMIYLCSRTGFSSMVLTAADRLLAQDESWWWHGRDKGELFRLAAQRLDPESSVRWAEINAFHFANRFFGANRVGRLLGYSTRTHAMPGNHATPFQGHVFQTAKRASTFAPSYHFVTDLGRDEAWTNLPGGPSESRFSKYYRSDISRWLDGEYKRLSVTAD